MPHRMVGVGRGHVGRQRQANEDAFRVMNPQNVWILADGMGGHAAGQIASQMAVEETSRFITDALRDPQLEWPFERDLQLGIEENALINGVRVANVRIYNRSIKDLPSWLRSGLAEVFRSDTVLMAERLRCSLSALGYFTYPSAAIDDHVVVVTHKGLSVEFDDFSSSCLCVRERSL